MPGKKKKKKNLQSEHSDLDTNSNNSSDSKDNAQADSASDFSDTDFDGITEIAAADVTDSKLRKILGENLDPEEELEIALASRRLLRNAWKARDELYQELFGPYTRVIPQNYGPPSADVSLETTEKETYDEGGSADPGDPAADEQHLAVLTYAPDPQRPYWMYVTAGLSSPWLQERPDEVSGFGCELILKSPVDAQWPPQVLRSMALHIFNHAGVLSPGKRVALNAPIAPYTDSALRNLFVWYPDEAPDCWYQLPSGGFGLFVAIGITDDELKYCESVEDYGTWCMQEVLRYAGSGQVSDPNRESVMTLPNIDEVLTNLRIFSENFRQADGNGYQ
ncbi:MAG: suppressor of fused domain protein [Candidatus Obscuribacterales bacterium]|nr:suppressor of fused domain protein [Candidatus Obscuribacterales bacterium]